MLGSDAILRALEHEGVDVAFGSPGGAILPTYDASARGTTVRHVLARHEQGAGHMAEGYARASGKVGVAIATSGPGATNLVTPIADAWMDSTPLVCITGQVRSSLIGTDAFQEIDATGITMPIVKHSWLVQDVEELPGVLKAAFHVARTGRQGPVLVDVAKDVQEAEFDFVYPDDVDLPGWKPPHKVHPRQLREAAKAIALAQLTAEVRAAAADVAPDRGPWLRQLEDWRERFPYRYAKADGVLKPQTAIEALRDLAATREEDVIWTTGVGQHQMWAMQYIQCEKPRSWITSGGLGTMGYGLPAAVGAKAARPDATVVCIDGDGCFQMTCQELATAALERLPIVAVVINNGWLGMVRQWQEMFYKERFAHTHLTKAVPDYAQLAEALGAAGFVIDSEDELEGTLRAALDAGRTAVVDARVDPDENCYPMVPAGAASVDVIELPDDEFEHERITG